MARGRSRTASSGRRAGRGGGISLGWIWLLVLALVALGVLVARTLDLPRRLGPRAAEPTPAAASVATHGPAAPALAAQATAPPTVPPQLTAVAAVAEQRPSITPTPGVTLRATVAATARATATARAPEATAARATAMQSVHATATAMAGRADASQAAEASQHAQAPQSVPRNQQPQPAQAKQQSQSAQGGQPAQATHGGPIVALTFDAGADRGYAQDILDTLAEAHILASFGITGQWAKANPDLVRRMAAEGHMVFDHTLDHQSFTGVSDNRGGLSAARRRQELEDADTIIAPLIGHSTKPWYRLPYGDDDAHVAADVAPIGFDQKVGWTVDSLGWRGASVQDIIARCLRLAAPKAIYVFHVGHDSRDGPALPTLVDSLEQRGFSFARVDEL